MAGRQRRARVRAAFSTPIPIPFAQGQASAVPRKRPAPFTIKRLGHAVLIALACVSGHAHAKRWYYNPYPWDPEFGKVYPSIDEYCSAMAPPGQKFIYSPELGGCYFFYPSAANDSDEWGSIQVSIVDCEDPNSAPKVERWVRPSCPCNAGYRRKGQQQCVAYSPPETPPDRKCDDGSSSGNPILPATGEKYRFEIDWMDSGPAPLSVERIYRSNWASYIARPDTGLGDVWTHNHGARLTATPALAPTEVAIVMPDGSRRSFAKVGSSFWVANGSADRLERSPGGGWTYRRADDNTTWAFDSAGKLHAKFDRNGWTTAYWYDAAGRLLQVVNPFGRTLAFSYNNAGQLTAITTPEARVISYRYDSAGRLSSELSLRERRLCAGAHRHRGRERRALGHLRLRRHRPGHQHGAGGVGGTLSGRLSL